MTEQTEAIPVHLYLALDRTGSMDRIRDDVIGGFNSFLADQEAKPGECVLTMVQFDTVDPFEVLYDAVPLGDVAELSRATYVPRSGTPLLDAEGRLIVMAEERVEARRAAGDVAEAIIFATYTDGLENASREWTFEALSAKKREHENDWAFIYLGVGHDAYSQSAYMGTQSVNTVSATRDAAGVGATMDWYVGEVDNARHRAAAGKTTNSAQTRSAQVGREARAEQDAAESNQS